MARSTASRLEALLLIAGAIVLVIASALGARIHWSSWGILLAAGTMSASSFAQTRWHAASECLAVTAAILSIGSVIGLFLAIR
jgi:4-hydroxybenzoate polyprenyltransferase